ncbi:hypothetical protein ROZALSC1DRAFT_26894 [Rozella allomycis CSF55]|uniref:Uncharacterized protein n=1 Tax=Rozella allomycis (strain CSF55) TaxID=988480 RepID=A0A075B549_ROZAC|nr:hypothetical protein O9G_004267 [Rozella allomycis CSF55]RKP21717.1 hypothetical protein ROZALSC1DRAFT_26894 [Rozella allomycis CSF55]|eukprot:EPZ36908.1 hypothetical protein O9G_004267 [Rozella allomycis CSF55]
MLKGISHVPSKIKLLARIGPLLQILDDVKVINEYLSVLSECIKSLEGSEKEALMNCCLPKSFVQRILRSNNMRELLSVESKIDIVANNAGQCIEDAALILSLVADNRSNVEDYPELILRCLRVGVHTVSIDFRD